MDNFNPFNPNSVVTPNLFAGRAEQILNICKKLSLMKRKMPASFFIYGERGIGKTALVKLIKYISQNKDKDLYDLNLLTSYYIVEQNQSIESVLQESLNKLTDQMPQTLIDKLKGKLGKLFENGKFIIGSNAINAGIELSRDSMSKKNTTIKDQSVSILSNIIKALDEEVDIELKNERSKEGVLIIIDEIHNLKDKDQLASILRNIITTLDVDGLGSVSFILVGYKEDMQIFFDGDPSSHRAFDPILLGTMPDKDAVDILKKGFKEIGLKYEDKVLDEGIFVAGGYPHSVQILGHTAVDVSKGKTLDKDIWKSAVANTSIELTTKDFARMFSFHQKLKIKDDILVFLAKENKPLSKKDIRKALNKNIYLYITELKKLGAIKEDEEGKIFLQSHLFRTAILIDDFLRNYQNKNK